MITILNCIFIISKPYLMRKIEQTKKRYFENISRKLPNKNLNPKKYWSLLNIVLNVQKIPCIPPIYHNNKFVSDIKTKGDLFNSYFSEQCKPLVNNSKFPSALIDHTGLPLESFQLSDPHCGSIIKQLNPNKAHGHDLISIGKLNLCEDSIWKNCLFQTACILLDVWKKSCTDAQKKKIKIKKLAYDIFINQLLSTTYIIFDSFDKKMDARALFFFLTLLANPGIKGLFTSCAS